MSKKFVTRLLWSFLIFLAVIYAARTARNYWDYSYKDVPKVTYAPVYILEMSSTNGYLEEEPDGNKIRVKKTLQEYQFISNSPLTFESRKREGLVGFWTESFRSVIRVNPQTMQGICEIFDVDASPRKQEYIVRLQLNAEGGFNVSFKDSQGKVYYGVFTPL